MIQWWHWWCAVRGAKVSAKYPAVSEGDGLLSGIVTSDFQVGIIP